MAITLGSMTSIAALSQSVGVATPADATQTQVTDAFNLADKRAQRQLDSTNVQLSVFGQTKSAYADLQAAAKGLATPEKLNSAGEARTALQTFVDAYNNAVKTTSAAVSGGADTRAILAANDLKRLVTNNNNAADLKKIGVSVNKNGSLSVDAKVLQGAAQTDLKAVKNTLGKIGAQTATVVSKELSEAGNIGGAVSSLSARAQSFQAKAAEQKKLATASLNTVQQQAANSGNTTGGIAAYLQTLSF
ncbi:MAG: flagellar filament capping protein FliD [Nitrosomonadales bacterium]|nr:flagellar filament capping protein FliD [Nitrosomonadales bacterium]